MKNNKPTQKIPTNNNNIKVQKAVKVLIFSSRYEMFSQWDTVIIFARSETLIMHHLCPKNRVRTGFLETG